MDLGCIRQWCQTCQAATPSWVDYGTERCKRCCPPDQRELWDWEYADD